MTTNSLFSNKENGSNNENVLENELSSEQSLELLVGEGKKYANAGELAKAMVHSQTHITTLESEATTLKEQALKQGSIDDILSVLKSNGNQEQQQSNDNQNLVDQQGKDLENTVSVAQQIKEALATHDQTGTAAANVAQVTAALSQSLGVRANEVYTSVGNSLAVDLDELAKTSPDAVIRLCTGQQQVVKQTGQLPNTTHLNNGDTVVVTDSNLMNQAQLKVHCTEAKIPREERFKLEMANALKQGDSFFTKQNQELITMGNNTENSQAIIRGEVWQVQLEEILHENLMGVPFVRQVEFPDGTQFTMPSIGTPLVRDLPEDTEITFDALDTGEVSITMNAPVVAANSLSQILMEDSLWAAEAIASIPVEQAQAIMERFETDTLGLAMNQSGGVSNANLINNVAHRKIGTGTNETMAVKDFAFAGYSLQKAKVSRKNLVAIVDPSVGFALETSTQLTNISNNPRWEGIIETGITDNFRFVRNVFGFDVFESNMLPTMNETIGGLTTTAGKANIFSSLARPSIAPFVLAWRRHPVLVAEWKNGKKRTEIDTTARWGSGLVREENIVVIGTDTDQVVQENNQ